MHRLFATILLVFAAFGLVLSPAAACEMGAVPVAVAAAAEPACHEMADAPAKPAPVKSDVKACCKSMCAPALLVAGAGIIDRPAATLAANDSRPVALFGVTHPLDKPPPRRLT